MGLAVAPNGDVYIADTNNQRYQVFTATGTFLRKWGGFVDVAHLQYPFGVALSSTGDVYAVDPYRSVIKAFDPLGTLLREWSAGTMFEVVGLAIDPFDKIYAASGGIQKFDLFGNQLLFIGYPAIQGVGRVATDSQGNLYASDNSAVRVIDSEGNLLRTIGEGVFTVAPGAIAVDGNGNVFVSGNDDTVYVFDAAGRLRLSWGGFGDEPGRFNGISGIAINKDGTRVYISDSNNNRIQVFEGFDSEIPFGWLTRDIGSVGVAGTAAFSKGTFTLAGSGADIWGSADAFRYVYQPLTGDGQIIARVVSLQNTQMYAKAGVMIRETLAASSRHAMVDLTPGRGAEFSRRSTTGGSTTVSGFSAAAPYWVKLVRQGNTFSGYVSSNGTNWSLVGTSTITMGSSVYIGLIVSSHNNSVLCTTRIDSVSIRGQVNIPTVALTAPASGSTYKAPASIPLSATATAGSGATVRQVNFYAGPTLIGTATTAPYQITWSSVPAGDYLLTAQVIDTAGGTVSSSAVAVSVIDSHLPPPWDTSDVGSVGIAGNAVYANGVFTVNGAGADIWGSTDAFRFVYQTLTGDGQIVARVAALQNTNGYAKAGVMFRQSLAANSIHAMMVLTPGYGAEFSQRTATGGSTTVTGVGGVAAPYWVKLVRSGNTFTGYISTNGTTWRLAGSSSIAMGTSLYVGLVVCSHNTAVLAQARLDSVTVTRPEVVPTATITSPASGATYTAPATIPVTATATPGTGATVSRVDFYAGSTLIGTATAAPYTVTWNSVPAGSYSLTAVATDSLGKKGTSTPVTVNVTSLPTPWATTDIGPVTIAGSATYLNGTFGITESGIDIWGSGDAFRFVYKTMTGDGAITARVASLQNTNSYAKSGVMIRETLAANAKHAMMDVTPVNGAEFLRRATTGGSTVSSKKLGVTAPYWVRVVRSGNTFTGYVSSDGVTWDLVGTSTISMNSTVYVGLAVCSHNTSALAATTIDHVSAP
ncbi:Ig-like domain-containing protein [Geomonas sp. RF6]|uniref:Ig-like domain-containing protein n=1 Tax=Geomonas sp. RF6 TaxID=2897342 RepID=UPI001E4FC97C|nr:Ig-like domain-containing protein [Geomonas sp. RF6]UFS72819.1 Ig-like domain-containing protein [Geomonas sp. RF6]